MGDLFDGYGSTLAPRKTPSGVPAFDEMFAEPAHAGVAAESRSSYRELYQALAVAAQLGIPSLAQLAFEALLVGRSECPDELCGRDPVTVCDFLEHLEHLAELVEGEA